MERLSTGLLQRLGIRYEAIDADGSIVPRDKEFWAMAHTAFPADRVFVADAFDEIVGSEREIDGVLRSGRGEYRLEGFKRGDSYLNPSILPQTDGELLDDVPGARGIIVLQDATAEMRNKQAIMQSRNETALLGEALRARNAEFQDANRRLDELMREIRTHNHDLDFLVKQGTAELRRSRLSVIATLARVAEFRDSDTGTHTYRIGRGSAIIGRHRGLSTERCEQLFYASLLHDVGKIGIPDSILLKQGALTPAEWAIMRDHTTIGAKILDRRDSALFDEAQAVALCHHERWDGSGYPAGLASEAIPLVGRICAVVDVFDALLSKRPYKEAWTVDKAIDTIREGSGKQFDPSVVESFLAVADEILAVRAESDELEFLPRDLE